jgi:uncharacterized membrane protein YedE/YeeE
LPTALADPSTALALAGLVLGAAFGAVMRRSHFCTMGAVSDLVLFGSLRRLRVWALAIATALAGTQALVLAGLVPIDGSPYLAPRLFWLGAILGGLLFGHGMVLAGGCAGRALVRLGGGSVKALLVLLLMGLTAFLVTSGPLAFVTRALVKAGSVRLGTPTGGLDALLSAAGLSATPARLLATLLLLAPLLAFCLADPKLRRSRADLATGAALGAVVALGWLATSTLGDAAAPSSLTFVGPAGDTLLWLMAGDGQLPGFGAAAVLGAVLGSAVTAAAEGQLRLEAFASADDTVRHALGGALMGVGGALAFGCSVGQGMTGVSALSLHALLSLAAILAGGWWGVKRLETGRLLPWPGRSTATGLPSAG